MKVNYIFVVSVFVAGILTSCKKEEETFLTFKGKYFNEAMYSLRGFDEEIEDLLPKYSITRDSFFRLVAKPWEQLSVEEKKLCDSIRSDLYVNRFNREIIDLLAQKIIPLSEVENYISNRYRRVSGFVEYCGDVKNWNVPKNWNEGGKHGELFFEGSPFWETPRVGVAMIRFRSYIDMNHLPSVGRMPILLQTEDGKRVDASAIPYIYPEPYVGSGFSKQGIPQYYNEKFAMIYDGEIYEITPNGREILRATYTSLGWKAYEGLYTTKGLSCDTMLYNTTIRNGVFMKKGDKYWHTFFGRDDYHEYAYSVSTQPEEGFVYDKDNKVYIKTTIIDTDQSQSIGFCVCETYIKSNVGDTLCVEAKTSNGLYILTTNDPTIAERNRMLCCDLGTYKIERTLLSTEELKYSEYAFGN
ncbi:MAG TPA: hypothetical protein DDY68_02955 [Porphyromonadaceae bacterium]|nr:hypothetical protein [Porphyromonadaceae bacterium]